MGFFDKIKKFVSKPKVSVEFTKIESPFKFGDAIFKATILVKNLGDSPVIIKGLTSSFYAMRVKRGESEEEYLGSVSFNSSNNYEDMRNGEYVKVFPEELGAGQEAEYGLMISGINILKKVLFWGAADANGAKKKNIKFFIKVEVDVKDTMMDPEIEKEVIVE